MGQLPQWAQKSILDTNLPVIDNKTSRVVEAPKGRWATRALEPNYDNPILDRNFYSQGTGNKGSKYSLVRHFLHRESIFILPNILPNCKMSFLFSSLHISIDSQGGIYPHHPSSSASVFCLFQSYFYFGGILHITFLEGNSIVFFIFIMYFQLVHS